MPFPVSTSPSATPALPADPLANANLGTGLGAPASETFDTLLVSKGVPAGGGRAADTKTEANPPLTVNSPSLALGRAATGRNPITAAPGQAEPLDTGLMGETAEAVAESPAEAVLRYQLVAGEWLVQPPPAPQPPIATLEAPAASVSSEVGEDTNSTAPTLAREPQQRTLAPAPAEAPSAAPAELQTLHPAQQRPELLVAGDGSSGSAGGYPAQPVSPGSTPHAPGTAIPSHPAAIPTKESASVLQSTPSVSASPASQPGQALPSVAAASTPQPLSQPAAAAHDRGIPAVSGNPSGNAAPAATARVSPAVSTPANLAAPAAEQAPAEYSGGYSPEERKDYRSLISNSKSLGKPTAAVGTSAATGENTMATAAASSSSLAAPAAHPSVVAHRDPVVSTSPELTLTPVAESAATHAPRLVHEIRDISERVSSIDRNTVEVQFDFNDQDRLSVRVEYRDGTVHTTFRTDSPDLRDTIAREWVTQAAADNRSFRSADPVFSSTTSGQQNFSSRDSHEHRQQAFPQGAPSFLHGSAPRGTGSGAAPASSTVPAVRRPETSVHLHTFA